MVRVIQANLQRSGLATDCLVRDIGVRHHPVIALIQEPYLGKQGKPLRIPAAFECYYGESNPRAAIIAHKSNLLLCPSYTSRDVTTCQITLETGEVAYLVSVYCDILVVSCRRSYWHSSGSSRVLILSSAWTQMHTPRCGDAWSPIAGGR